MSTKRGAKKSALAAKALAGLEKSRGKAVEEEEEAVAEEAVAAVPQSPAASSAVGSEAETDENAGPTHLTKKQQAAKDKALGKSAGKKPRKTTIGEKEAKIREAEAEVAATAPPPPGPAPTTPKQGTPAKRAIGESPRSVVTPAAAPTDRSFEQHRAMKRPRQQPVPQKKPRLTVNAGDEEAQPAVEKKKKKPHRYRPGTRSIIEIRQQQKKSDHPATLFAPFVRLCREIDQDIARNTSTLCPEGHRWTEQALRALQVAGEDRLIELYQAANDIVILEKNVTLMPREMRLADKLMHYRHKLASGGKH